MGLYKSANTMVGCATCEHAWWGSFRKIRVSLPKWENCDIHSKSALRN